MKEKQLQNSRHTLSHLLASAVQELYPHAKPTLGPQTDTGFYYDFDFETDDKLTEKDLVKIENKMREMLKHWEKITLEEVTKNKALQYYKDNKYKIELIEELANDEKTITFYHSGNGPKTLTTQTALFTDLCSGGHVEHPNIDLKNIAFKLDHIAGAYWRGDEKNKMLTRIYGLAFATKKDMEAHEKMLAEAKKRDHRKLGKDLDLFSFSELVGPGLPLWSPKGTIMRHELDAYVWELREARGYSRVSIPHITKKDLYIKSGHWDKFADELLRVMTREGKEYALKPMNCPHHIQIFTRKPHSYREMPQRYAETTHVYRDEQSGELSGLTRVLSITQDDSHVFCRRNQVKEEFLRIWDIVDALYTTFHFDLHVRLSFHDPDHMEMYLGEKHVWEEAEKALYEIAKSRNIESYEAKGEAAMYGPKLDFIAKDSIGREHQVATIQLDFNLPERFDLTCINEKGEQERIVMIHAAIMGSLERFLGVLIEHTSGNFPFWVAPIQVRIVPVAQAHVAYAESILSLLKENGIRAEYTNVSESFGKRVRASKVAKLPFFIVLGDTEVTNKTITLESREGDKKEMSEQELIEYFTKLNKNRT